MNLIRVTNGDGVNTRRRYFYDDNKITKKKLSKRRSERNISSRMNKINKNE